MKRLMICLLVLLFFVALCACGSASADDTAESTKPPVTIAPEHVCELQDVSGEHASICTICGEKLLKSEAHSFVRKRCNDYGVCSVCGETDPPEEHDWGPEVTQEDCWSITVTKTCSKCHTENRMHGDYGWPRHIWKEETEDGKTTFSCTRCKESYSYVGEIAAFSYAKVLEDHKLGDPGVQQKDIYRDIDGETISVIDAIMMARLDHLTVEYDTIAVSFDEATGVWGVDFYTSGIDGGGQSIYLNPTDKTCYIVCGE